MPKKPGLNVRLANALEAETIIPQPEIPLTLDERIELRKFLTGDLFRKVLNNVRTRKPSIIADGIETPNAGLYAIKRLAEIRGWTLFEAALALQCADVKIPKTAPKDSYPDAGRV